MPALGFFGRTDDRIITVCMTFSDRYLQINQASWDARTEAHLQSGFYDLAAFKAGQTSLKEIETALLGELHGKRLLHLQCHFGQDTLSLARLGAEVTGLDLSGKAIAAAQMLAEELEIAAQFVCGDVYQAPQLIADRFDWLFTTYGVLGWLPDLDRWAAVVAQMLKPGGKLLLVEFHPVVWMFDADFEQITYKYDKAAPIEETETGSYADPSQTPYPTITWNHGLAETIQALISHGLQPELVREYDFSPYNCFRHTVETEPGRFRIRHLGDKIPMVYAIRATKR